MQRSYYAIIPANLRYDKRITANAKLLYGEITALCNDKGYCWATNSYFAELYDKDKGTISRWISSLEKGGYISSKLVYKEGSKEIIGRHIMIAVPVLSLFDGGSSGQNDGEGMSDFVDTSRQKAHEGLGNFEDTPIGKNAYYNTTVNLNTTVNNTNDIEDERVHLCCTDVQRGDMDAVVQAWNELGLTKVTKVNNNTARYRSLSARIREYGVDVVVEAVKSVGKSRFLLGLISDWTANFDWLLKPSNFIKVKDGNYVDKGVAGHGASGKHLGKDSNNGVLEQYDKHNNSISIPADFQMPDL